MFCYHHIDIDGKAAGWIVHKWADRNGVKNDPTDYAMTNYGDNFDKHRDGEDIVFIVDLSFTEPTYDRLMHVCNTAKRVIWIDHHSSSKDLVMRHKNELDMKENLVYLVDDHACGALLTYAFCMFSLIEINLYVSKYKNLSFDFDKENKSGIYISITSYDDVGGIENRCSHSKKYSRDSAINMIDDHDRWIHDNPSTSFFILGCDAEYTGVVGNQLCNTQLRFNDRFWDSLNFYPSETSWYDRTEKLIREGKVIQKYLNSLYSRQMRNTFEVMINNHRCLVKNAMGNSTHFMNKYEKYDAVILFWYDGSTGLWNHSIYSSGKFNCQEFAEQFGGGGHKGAAGFTTAGKESLFYKNACIAFRESQYINTVDGI